MLPHLQLRHDNSRTQLMNTHQYQKKQSPQRKEMLKHTNAYHDGFMPKWLWKLALTTASKPQDDKKEIHTVVTASNTKKKSVQFAKSEPATLSPQEKQARYELLKGKYHQLIHRSTPLKPAPTAVKDSTSTAEKNGNSILDLKLKLILTQYQISKLENIVKQLQKQEKEKKETPADKPNDKDIITSTPKDASQTKMLWVIGSLLSAGPLMMASAKLDKTFGTNTAPYSLLLFAAIQVGALFTSLQADKERVEAEKKIEPPISESLTPSFSS